MDKFDVKNNIDLSSKAIAETSKIQKDQIDLSTIDTINIADKPTSPIFNGPVYDIIRSNAFKVIFSEEFMTPYINIIGVSKPKFDLTTNEYMNDPIKLCVSYINKKMYFGKPTVITNVALDSDIIKMAYEFNDKRPEFMEVIESNESDVERIITKYSCPLITDIEFSPNDKYDEEEKYVIFTIEYSNIEQFYPEYEK